jgi:hypothetical protein
MTGAIEIQRPAFFLTESSNQLRDPMRQLDLFSALQSSNEGIGIAFESAAFGGAVTSKEVNK